MASRTKPLLVLSIALLAPAFVLWGGGPTYRLLCGWASPTAALSTTLALLSILAFAGLIALRLLVRAGVNGLAEEVRRRLKGVPCVAIAAVALLAATQAHAQVVVSDPVNQALSTQSLLENARQTLQMGQQLEQLRAVMSAAKEDLEIARTVYAGVSEFRNFDPQRYLENGRDYFRSHALVEEATGFARDASRGLKGGHAPSLDEVAHAIDIFGDRTRYEASGVDASDVPEDEAAYDAAAALSLSGYLNGLVANPSFQRKMRARPPASSVSDGLFQADLARRDPGLWEELTQQRVATAQAQEASLGLYEESMTASVGKAQQLTSIASTRSALELQSINARLAEQAAREKLAHQRQAAADSAAARNANQAFNALDEATERAFGQRPAPYPVPSVRDR